MTISKGERDELRRVVRTDFKVLDREIGVREAELAAEIEQAIARRFEPSESALAAAQAEVSGIVTEANTKMATVIEGLAKQCDGYKIDWRPVAVPYIEVRPVARNEMRRALLADLTARVSGAKVKIQRQEADMLRKLAADALESDEAKAFLGSIPTVGELVSSDRLAELEAQFDTTGDAS